MWIYLQTVLVYLMIAVVTVALAKRYVTTNRYSYIIVAILFYSIIFGLRYGVGGDFFGYLNAFNSLSNTGQMPNEEWEPGFMLLMRFCAIFHSSSFFFFLIAFLQLDVILLGFKNKPQLYPYFFLVFVLTGVWLHFGNGLRQILALSFWVFSLKYAAERSILKHYILLLLAFSFHNSAIILLPFYFIFGWKLDWFRNIKVELLLLGVSLIVMSSSFIQELFTKLDVVVEILGYSHYATYKSESGDLLETENTLGIGFFINLLINIIIITNSNKMKAFYNSNYFTLLYSLFYIGVISNYIFLHSQLFGRLVVYFYSFSFIIIGATLFFFKKTHKRDLYHLLLALVILIFVAVIYKASSNWALFVFNWQDEYFYLHEAHNNL